MSADQTKHKKPFGKSNRSDRNSSRRLIGKPGNGANTDPSGHQSHGGHDEEKINRIDHSQQIGEFSNWSRRG
jgi:hypothetical protein